MMRYIIAVLAAGVLGAALWVGAKGVGAVPPVGALLDPANGIWHVAASAQLPREARAKVPGLTAPVRVIYDDRAVPHIFAVTEGDAQRALGYVVARDRLFQLEVQSRAGAGTLTELLGPAALAEDRATRAAGLGAAAEWKLASVQRDDSGEMALLTAFADGANAYIDHLAPRDYPFEYQLLRRPPRRWEPVHAIHLFGRMAYTLSYNDDELRHLRASALVGRAAAEALFPVNNPLQEPIQPSRRREPRTNFRAIPPPGNADPRLFLLADAPRRRGNEAVAIGSNNWAVAPQRTRAGYALLAGDPHLELTLPSIWYEAHLVVPGALDAYGVTIPGAPSIILGFNRDIAWTSTNVEGDFLDRYVETVDDSARPTRYRLDGAWRPLTLRIESYNDASGRALATDTIYWTHRGPMRRTAGRWISMRWTALDSSVSPLLFERGQHARSAAEWMEGMRSYRSPAQNLLVADRVGTIAIRSTGAFPIRPGNGRGDLLRDGSTSKSDWTGYVVPQKYPRSANPARGFLSSNNQQPLDPADDKRYLGADWPAPWRAIRINELMRANANVTPDDMRRWQTDPHSARAEVFVPAFLAAARARPGDTALAPGARYLAQWDRTYTVDNQRAILFEFAMRELVERTWDELDPASTGLSPDGAVLVELMQQPRSPWWDDRRTPGVIETRDDILCAALTAAYRRAEHELGGADDGGWRWGRNRQATIMHLLRIPALSVMHAPSQGGSGTLNPLSASGTEGASWRMVVELGPEVRAWGTYPGGQSGNPASARYMDHVDTWSRGELDTLRFPHRASELDRRYVTSTLVLTPERR